MKVKKPEKVKFKHCLNCGAEISGSNYCPECGQKNTDKKLTTYQFIKDFLSEYFTFDSKFFRSVKPLMLQPGHLSKEYVNGRRERYILPLRLYIFITFIFFFIFALNTKFDKKISNEIESKTKAEQIDSLKNVLEGETDLSSEQKHKIITLFDSGFVFKNTLKEDTASNDSTNFVGNSDNFILNYLKDKEKYLSSLGKEAIPLLKKEAVNQIPKVLFLFLPFFALMLKLLYIRNHVLYIEHLIFSIHIHTFLFFLLIFLVFFTQKYVVLAAFLIMLVYLFMSIRNFYGQGIVKSLVKMSLILTGYLFLVVPALVLLVILTVVSI